MKAILFVFICVILIGCAGTKPLRCNGYRVDKDHKITRLYYSDSKGREYVQTFQRIMSDEELQQMLKTSLQPTK